MSGFGIDYGAIFKADIAKKVENNDLEGLKAQRARLIASITGANKKFAMVTNWKIEQVENGIRQLEPVNEEALDEAGRLGSMVKRGIANARDRALYGIGSQSARGRLDLSAATAQVWKDWRRYVGREVAAGDKQVAKRPSLRNLEDFLSFTYGFKVGDEQLLAIIPKQDQEQEESPSAAQPKSDADHAQSALSGLKSTSAGEYNSLKAKFSKAGAAFGNSVKQGVQQARQAPPKAPTPKKVRRGPRGPMNLQMPESVNEGVIEDTTFDPDTLFPRLANILIRNGLMQVHRGDEKLAAKGRDSTGGVGVEQNTTVDARLSPDGHAINVVKMKEVLEQHKVTGDDMALLKGMLADNNDKEAFNQISRSPEASKTMASLVDALFRSISTKNSPDVKNAAHSITADGHTMDINKFMEYVKSKGVKGAELSQIFDQVKGGGVEGLMSVLGKHGHEAGVIFKLAKGVVKATGSSTPKA